MLEHEEFIKKFTFGISVLSAYLKFNNKSNYTDINIISEGFAKELLNALYNWRLTIPTDHFMPGYDLISIRDRVIVQVTANCTPQKVQESFLKLDKYMDSSNRRKKELEKRISEERRNIFHSEISKNETIKKYEQEIDKIIDISGYTVYFMFLKEDANRIINYGSKNGGEFRVPNGLVFNQRDNVISFHSLISKVTNLSQPSDSLTIEKVNQLMLKNIIFGKSEYEDISENRISSIVDEYADNFQSPLFLHRYHNNTKVTLEN